MTVGTKTKILLDDKEARFADLKNGQHASVILYRVGVASEIKALNISDQQPLEADRLKEGERGKLGGVFVVRQVVSDTEAVVALMKRRGDVLTPSSVTIIVRGVSTKDMVDSQRVSLPGTFKVVKPETRDGVRRFVVEKLP